MAYPPGFGSRRYCPDAPNAPGRREVRPESPVGKVAFPDVEASPGFSARSVAARRYGRRMTTVQWRCPTHGVIDTVLDMVNPEHPTCPVLIHRSAPGESGAGECRQPLRREVVQT